MSLLVSLDLTRESEGVIALARLLAATHDCELVLLHVCDRPPPLHTLIDLHRRAEPLRLAGLRPRLRTVRGDAVEAICTEALARGSEWIVLDAGTPATEGVFANAKVAVAAVDWRGAAFQAGPALLAPDAPGGAAARAVARMLASALGGEVCEHASDAPVRSCRDGHHGAWVIDHATHRDVATWPAEIEAENVPTVVVSTPAWAMK